MARRRLLTGDERRRLFDPPVQETAIIGHYTLSAEDVELVGRRYGPANRLGLAAQIALMRHPGFGLQPEIGLPDVILQYLAAQLFVDPSSFSAYGQRAQTRTDHADLVARYLGIRPFRRGDLALALNLAAQAAEYTPVSIKARGADVHFWGRQPATAAQVLAAGRAADGLLAVSAAMRDDMIALGMPGERIAVHHTGIDHSRFAPAPRAPAKAALGVTGPLVVSVGALIPRKGHDRVIGAVAALPGVSLIVAGEGPERSNLEAMIAAEGLGDRVRLTGAVAHDAMPGLMAAADVMALASASEGLANVWVEALACGTPIVVPDVGGAREVVTDPAHGRLVAPDPAAIAAGIADLLAAPPDPAAVATGAARFSWEANAAGLYDHLRSLGGR